METKEHRRKWSSKFGVVLIRVASPELGVAGKEDGVWRYSSVWELLDLQNNKKKKNVKGKGERVCTSCWSQQCCIILEPAGKMENVAGFWLILVIASCCWLLEKGGSGRRSLFAGGWDKEMDVLWF